MGNSGKKRIALCGFSDVHATARLVHRHEGFEVEWQTLPWQGDDSLELLQSAPVDVLVLRPNMKLTGRIQSALAGMENKPVVLVGEYLTPEILDRHLTLFA